MIHLALEDLARLVDEDASAAEAAHLEVCPECRHTLEEMREQTVALGALPDLEPPARSWAALETRLLNEGLMRRQAVVVRGPWTARAPWLPAVLRAAAAVVLFLGGGVLGAEWRERDLMAAVEQAGGTAVRPVTAAGTDAPLAQRLRAAEAAYLAALTEYAEANRSAPVSGDPIARLAALETIVLTTRAALDEAPTDPVINGYHLTALAEREATIKQIATAGSWF